MPHTVNLLVPPKGTSRKPRGGETKCLGPGEKKARRQDVTIVEVPTKREMPKKEKKKLRSTCRKHTNKASSHRRKCTSRSLRLQDTVNPSTTCRIHKESNYAISDDRSIEKKKEDEAKPEIRSITLKPPYKVFNVDLAQKFFKQMMESHRARSRRRVDSTMEVMPDSRQSSSTKSIKSSKTHRRGRHKPLDRNIFKENGEPVWMVPDRAPDELVMNEDGEQVRYPELMAALEEEGLEMEDGKGWFQRMSSYFIGELDKGRVETPLSPQDMDPLGPVEVLESRSDVYFSKDTVVYNTTDSIFNLCHNAIERFSQQEATPFRTREDSKSASKEEERTCVETSIRFNMASSICISYDRRCPITSIQKFRKKYRELLNCSCTNVNKVKEKDKGE